MADKDGETATNTDLAGYDHSQRSGQIQRGGEGSVKSDTYVDKDHDGGWSSQVAMEGYEDRSGGDAYARMSRGILDESYGRGQNGLAADAPPKSKG